MTINRIPSDMIIDRGTGQKLSEKLSGVETSLAEKAKKISIDIREAPYNAKGDGVTDDTNAIINAINANAGKTILFADGVFCISSPITISNDCNIKFSNATLKAIALMDWMINYETSRTITNAFSLSRDGFIVGGKLDGNNKAKKLLRLNKFLHFTLKDMRFYNGINRGLVVNDVASMSAELVASDLYFANDTADSITDNIAIENLGGDNFYSDINIVDWTVGIKDTRNATWTRIHPWISQKVRLPNSKCYWLNGDNFTLTNCIVDSTQYGYYLESGVARIVNTKSYWEVAAYDDTYATNYPITMFHNAGTGTFYVDGAIVNSGSVSIVGSVKVITNTASPSGFYKDIITKGTTGVVTNIPTERIPSVAKGTFTPTLKGSTVAGAPTYTQQTGKYYKTGDVVNFTLSIIATIDTTMSGALKIGGLPFTCGAMSNGLSIGYFQGFTNNLLAYTVTSTTDILVAYSNSTSGFAYSDAVPLRSTQVTITVSGSYHV